MNPATIYCDEAGFTGPNLLDKEQHYFVYSAVAVEPQRAAELIQKIRADYCPQGAELKASNLHKSSKGRQAIDYLFDQLHDHIRVIVCEKKYALGGKFFEYVFEPALAEQSALFYEAGFHEFIATTLYYYFLSKDKSGEAIFSEFQSMARGKTGAVTPEQFWSIADGTLPDLIVDIRDFCIRNRATIDEELQGTGDSDANKWLLDLTNTCLYMLLCEMGDRHGVLDVFCDESKPLADGTLESLDVMIGRTDLPRRSLGDKESALAFNLHRRIQFASSVSTPGVQLADLASGAVYSFFMAPELWKRAAWTQYFPSVLSGCSILPHPSTVDTQDASVLMNAMLLKELAERCRKDAPLLHNLGSLFANMDRMAKKRARKDAGPRGSGVGREIRS